MTDSNRIYGWGFNDCRQLATKPVMDYLTPIIIKFPKNDTICQISCGYYHSLALTSDGDVYGWGYNTFGQIGTGEVSNAIPVPIKLQFIGNECEYKIQS